MSEKDIESQMTEAIDHLKESAKKLREFCVEIGKDGDEGYADSLKVCAIWNDVLCALNKLEDAKDDIFL
jgi:hypothetical protein